jgi:3-methyladenine DNA glycosylase AlkD
VHKQSLKKDLDAVIASLKRLGTKSTRDGMARFAIPSDKAFGVTVGDIRKVAKQLGRDHDLALDLWETGLYEPRMLACFVDDPKQVTPTQMDRWCRDFDSWAICDTACFHLFDRTPHSWRKVEQWAGRRDEFVKRAAFALLATLALHDKKTGDQPFVEFLALIEREANDNRNFVKKAVNWALRAIGKRNRALHTPALATAERLSMSDEAAARWIGRDALRELSGPEVTRRLAGKK